MNSIVFKLNSVESTAVVLWYYLSIFIGMVIFPLISSVFPRCADYGYGVSKTVGIFLLFYFNWIGVHFFPFFNMAPGLFLSLLIYLLVLHKWGRKTQGLNFLLEKKWKEVFCSEGIFLVLFIFFLIANSYHPSIEWGEKPMDFTLFNYMRRNVEFPVDDPWFSGRLMHYYYFGYFIFAGLSKLSGVSAEVGYALCFGTLAGLTGQVLASIVLRITNRLWIANLAGIFLVTAGNWKSVRTFLFTGQEINFNYFWGNTRIFKYGFFAEFPSWSFLFADLHPHVMAYPFSLAFLYFIVSYLYRFDEKRSWSFYLLMSMLWGGLLALNVWDYIHYTFLFGLLLLLTNPKDWLRTYLRPSIIGIGGLIFFIPILLVLRTGKKFSLVIHQGESNTLFSIFDHLGLFIIILSIIWVPLLISNRRKLKRFFKDHLVFKLIIAIFTMVVLVENISLMDRMNTVFKNYNNFFILLGIVAISSLKFWNIAYVRTPRLVQIVLVVVCLNLGLMAGHLNIKAINNGKAHLNRPSLYGSEYLKKKNPSDYQLIQWMRKNILGTPVLVERYGRSFDHSTTRLSMHTGVPIYLGWDGHVTIRGASPITVKDRKKHIDIIYSSTDAFQVYDMLRSFNINFVAIGPVERVNYPKWGLAKFDKFKELFIPVATFGESTLYGVGEFKKYLVSR